MINDISVPYNYRINNLNLIRLFAASQVLIGHWFQHVVVSSSMRYFSLFNGVPIFFTISGFLIFWSYDNNPSIKQYCINRCLRIYPALIVALILAIFLMFAFGIIRWNIFTDSSFYLWLCTQLTFFQEFAPGILHGFGSSNAPNPPLWTISVEILLYMFIPLLYNWIRGYTRKGKTIILLIVGVLSYYQNQTGFISDFLGSISDNGYWLIFIWPFCQFMNFTWFFIVGIFYYLYKDIIIPKLAGKGWGILIIYILLCILGYKMNVSIGSYAPHGYSLLLYFVLTLTIFSVAYTKPEFTTNFIGKTDISYGLYIYHMLVMNAFIELGFTSNRYLPFCLFICVFIAFLSWNYIEKKALKLKPKSLYKG